MSMAMVISPQNQPLSESANGHPSVASSSKLYPPPTAQYEELVQSSELFWEKLKAFHQSFGTKFMVPTVGGKALDLHLLFVEVTSRGGLEKVIKDRKWKEVIVVFNFPTTITSASFVLRKYYMSLLYHFEQVYYFHRQAPSLSAADLESGNEVEGSLVQNDGASTGFLSSQRNAKMHPGSSITGFIDGKFDNGYLVTVNLGDHELKGVLYHIPQVMHMSQSAVPSEIVTHRKRRRSRMKLRDPFRPKSNRSGYNFFFAEHYARLKPQYYGRERAISKKIGYLWNNLTEAEKQVYQEKGVRDKERYKSEMQEYRSSQGLNIGKV